MKVFLKTFFWIKLACLFPAFWGDPIEAVTPEEREQEAKASLQAIAQSVSLPRSLQPLLSQSRVTARDWYQLWKWINTQNFDLAVTGPIDAQIQESQASTLLRMMFEDAKRETPFNRAKVAQLEAWNQEAQKNRLLSFKTFMTPERQERLLSFNQGGGKPSATGLEGFPLLPPSPQILSACPQDEEDESASKGGKAKEAKSKPQGYSWDTGDPWVSSAQTPHDQRKTMERYYGLLRSEYCGHKGQKDTNLLTRGFARWGEQEAIYSFLKHHQNEQDCVSKIANKTETDKVAFLNAWRHLFYWNQSDHCGKRKEPQEVCLLNQAALLDLLDAWRVQDPQVPVPVSLGSSSGAPLKFPNLTSDRCVRKGQSFAKETCLAEELLKANPGENGSSFWRGQDGSLYGPRSRFGKGFKDWESFGTLAVHASFVSGQPGAAPGGGAGVARWSRETLRNIHKASPTSTELPFLTHPIGWTVPADFFQKDLAGAKALSEADFNAYLQGLNKSKDYFCPGEGKLQAFLHQGGERSLHCLKQAGNGQYEIQSFYPQPHWWIKETTLPGSSGKLQVIREPFVESVVLTLKDLQGWEQSIKKYQGLSQWVVGGIAITDPFGSLAYLKQLYQKPKADRTALETEVLQDIEKKMKLK